MHHTSIISTTFLTLALSPAAAFAGDAFGSAAVEQPASNFVFSAAGAGKGNTILSLGVRQLGFGFGETVNGIVPIPLLDLHLATGLSDAADFALDYSTLVVFHDLDLRGSYRLLGGLDSGASLALRGGLSSQVAFGDESVGSLAVTPGLGFSFGGRGAQLSLIADFPIYFAAGGVVHDRFAVATVWGPAIRPAIALEVALSDSLALNVRANAEANLRFTGNSKVFGLSVGLAW